jgi:hypothetical protein
MNEIFQPIKNENKIGKDITGLSVLNSLDELIAPMLEAWAENDIDEAQKFAQEIKKKAINILSNESKHLHAYVAIGLSLTIINGINGFKEGVEIVQKALEMFPNMYPITEIKRKFEADVLMGGKYTNIVDILSSRTTHVLFSETFKSAYDISCKIENDFGAQLRVKLKNRYDSLCSEAHDAGLDSVDDGDKKKTAAMRSENASNSEETGFGNSGFNRDSAKKQLQKLKNDFSQNDPFSPVNIALDLALLWCKGEDINHLLEHREDFAKVAEFVEKLKQPIT